MAHRHAASGDHDDSLHDGYGAMSSKVPPSWSPETDRRHPFRVWLADLTLWVSGAELPEPRQGPAVAMRIGGTARKLLREMDPATMKDGSIVVDPQGGQVTLSGVESIVRALKRRYAPLSQELQVQSLNEVFRFHRRTMFFF